MKSSKALEIRSLDATGFRCAVVVDGLVRYVGSQENCTCWAQSLCPQADREHQDAMLLRAVA